MKIMWDFIIVVMLICATLIAIALIHERAVDRRESDRGFYRQLNHSSSYGLLKR